MEVVYFRDMKGQLLTSGHQLTFVLTLSGSLVAEISALRQYYLNTGGHDPVMVQQLTDMLKESEGLSNKSNTNTVAPYRAPKAVPQSASQLTEQLYAMESENYRLQSELIRMEENPRSSGTDYGFQFNKLCTQPQLTIVIKKFDWYPFMY